MLDRLPVELLESVLGDDCVAAEDIANVAVVCSRLATVVANSNVLWKNKFTQKFADLLPVIGTTSEPWRQWYERAVTCSRRVRFEVERMLPLYYRKEELPKEAFETTRQIIVDFPLGYELVTRELKNILSDGQSDSNLTLKYYAEKTLGFVIQDHLRTEWQDIMSLSPNEQSIEKGAVLLSKWFQPTLDLDEDRDFRIPLDRLASLVKHNLCVQHPDHPISNRSGPIVTEPILIESLWSPFHCLQVLSALSQTLYGEIGFRGEETNYYAPVNSYLNRVLETKTGIPITLSIVYMSVARRLGVVCEPVAFPTHFFLRICDHPNHPDPANRYTYIDAFNGGRLRARGEMRCPYAGTQNSLPPSSYEAATPSVVFERMARNLVEAGCRQGNTGREIAGIQCLRYGLELLAIFRPDDVESTLLLARIYLHLGINLHEVLISLQTVLIRDPSQTGVVAQMYKTCKSQLNNAEQTNGGGSASAASDVAGGLSAPTAVRRPADGSVRYAVGMVMVHEMYNYTCVIFGWDALCSASREWIVQMGVHGLANKEFQPFYNVLVDDGSIRYAAQENLRVASAPTRICHPDVGKYFASFQSTHFVPNKEKLCEYPDDEEVRNKLVKEITNMAPDFS